MSFHDTRFPTDISLGANGGPERKTDIVTLGSGREERNARWADSRRRYNAGYGVKTLDQLHAVIAFFEARRGRLHAFRWRDPSDWKSVAPGQAIGATDVSIGVGDGASVNFQLVKPYGEGAHVWFRTITKPVADSVQVAVDGDVLTPGDDVSVDHTTGAVTIAAAKTPPPGSSVTAGFAFDVPVRFDTDTLEINVAGFRHGAIPSIPILEVRL
jgi:uncharacterized protein (TIGR02217 family)